MNILVICHYGLYLNFSNSFVHAQTAAYTALGHRVRAIVHIPVGKRDWDGSRFSGPVQRRDQDGVEIYLVRHLSFSNYGEKKGINLACSLRTLSRYAHKLLEGFTPDIIHAHTLGTDSEIGAWLKERLGVPLVVTTHGETVCDAIWNDRLYLKRVAERADAVVAVSSMLRKTLEESGAPVPTRVILNGFHVRNISKNKEKVPFSIIQAGYLVARKKADVTIRAFAELQRRHSEFTLELVGSGVEMERFQTLSRQLGVLDAVRFSGFLPNNEALEKMAKAQFFVMPSIHEGFGIVYLEAMASGCITIGTEGEGIADLIISGENGFLVPPDDPDAIVRTVEWCLSHPEEAARIAERGRRDALGLTWEHNATQYIDYFKLLCPAQRQA